MKRIEKLQNTPFTMRTMQEMLSSRDEEKGAFEELFACMQSMAGYKEILQKHKTTAKELHDISSRISLAYGYEKGHYVPVALVALGKPLDFVLENKDKILNHSLDEIHQVVERAIPLL